jgi:hypothetical protein
MYRHTTFTLTTLAALCLAVALPVGTAAAQQKQKVSFKVSADNAKYTQQLNINVGDEPNHIMRVYEIHAIFPNNAPVLNGVKVSEAWSRGDADLTDGNGSGTQYIVFVMENGDRFFVRNASLVQNIAGQFTATQTGTITGGTGKMVAIQGVLHLVAKFNIQTGVVENQYEIEYSIGK